MSAPLDCAGVLTRAMDRSTGFAAQVWRGQQPVLYDQLATMMEKAKSVMVSACQDDHWSGDLLDCIDRMTVTDDPHKCNHLFTSDQAVDLTRRMMAMVLPKTPP
jgi:hypothetical protein